MYQNSGYGRYILSFDEGTTYCKASIWDDRGSMVSLAKKQLTVNRPKLGWVETDPEIIWRCQIEAAREAINLSGIGEERIVAIGIANQRETTILWDEWGKPVYPAVIWQDRRTEDSIRKIDANDSKELSKITGLIPDPYFSATKIKWILDHLHSNNRKMDKIFAGTVDSWLIYRLTAGKFHVTDYSNASRTMLFDIRKGEWSNEALAIFGIDKDILPEVIDSQGGQIVTSGEIFDKEIPILSVIGDQQASLYGHLALKKGEMKNTYGTGSFFLQNTGSEIVRKGRLITGIAWKTEGAPITYSIEGNSFNTGSLLNWLRNNLNIDPISEELSGNMDSSNRLYFVPALNGLGAPYWESSARGSIFGITEVTSRQDFMRAALESIAFRVRDIIEELKKYGGLIQDTLAVDGGLTANNYLMQFQSDILEMKVFKPENEETTSAGAAYMAGISSGMLDIDYIKSTLAAGKTYIPRMEREASDKLYDGWIKAVKSTLGYHRRPTS